MKYLFPNCFDFCPTSFGNFDWCNEKCFKTNGFVGEDGLIVRAEVEVDNEEDDKSDEDGTDRV